MSLGKQSAPTTPDYTGAAEATAAGNRINQYTPYGSLTYKQEGTDSQGHPTYGQTVALSPEQQKILDYQNQTSIGLGEIQGQGLDYVKNMLSKPFDTSQLPAEQINAGQTAQDAIMSRLNPQFDRRQASLETQMANQGIARGTEAWKNGQMDVDNARNDAMTQAALQGMGIGQQARQQSMQEQSFLRNEPLNTLNAVRSGSQVTGPQFQGTPQGANYSGAIQNQFNANLAGVNANNANTANTFNGLIKLGTAGM